MDNPDARHEASPLKLLFIPTKFRQAGGAKRRSNYWESARGTRHYFTNAAEGRVALSLAKCGWPPLASAFRVEERDGFTFVVGMHSIALIEPKDSVLVTRMRLTTLYQSHNAAIAAEEQI